MNEKPRLNTKKQERVTLSESAVLKLKTWQDQVTSLLRGTKVSMSDLTNWVVSRQKPDLAHRDLLALEREFFDPIKTLEWTLREARKALLEGRDVDRTYLDLMAPKRVKGKKRQSDQKTARVASLVDPLAAGIGENGR